jgi:3-ketosteroid 9alpha-monooxygenase subunit A
MTTRVEPIRTFEGETPLQAMARLGAVPRSQLTSRQRFPYYTAFPFAWYFCCFGDDLPAGTVRSFRYLARDLVAWRTDDGVPHVAGAYCPHLGAHLGFGGRVEGDRLVCPYHWWEYDGEGRNVRIPYSTRCNQKARLTMYPTAERNGMVWFWYHPRGEEPLWELPELPECSDPAYTDYMRAEWIVTCPWQELAENGPDFIHLRTVHGAADVPELEALEYDGFTSRFRARVNFATPRGPQPGRIETDSWGPGFGVARFSGIIDTFFVNGTTPIDFEQTLNIKAYKVRVDGDSDEARTRARRVGEALVRDLTKQMAEDNVIFNNKIHQAHPALADADGPIAEFRRWAKQFYVPGDPLAVNR